MVTFKSLSFVQSLHPLWKTMYDPQSQLPVHLAMLLAQLLSGVYYVITKVAFISGMHPIVLSLYRDLVALLVLLPATYYFEKNNPLKLSFSVLARLFLLGCTWSLSLRLRPLPRHHIHTYTQKIPGPSNMFLYKCRIFGSQLLLFAGITFTSAEFSAAMQPCIPVFIAIIAITFRVDKVNWCKRDGQAKVAGIVICCSGAAVMALYRGPSIFKSKQDPGGLTMNSASPTSSSLWMLGSLTSGEDVARWRFGALCLIGNCLCMAASINIQAPLLKEFPSPVSVTAYSYAMGAMLMGFAGIFLVEEKGAWSLSWDVNLLAVIYNGMVASALNFGLMTWCVKRVGPLFVASYIPIQPIMAAVFASIFLGSQIYQSSLIGTSLIFVGLFLVSWAQEETLRLASLKYDVEANSLLTHEDDVVQGLQEPLMRVEQRI
ncbi:hypothetical protein O6H91_14G062900 [Diphasiastrum complanatum]|uniref:Uncharacterized protein n=1 Tax=Diphasiastrum complanatum TaxID=34168 RepID=A0ACC2BQT6_DIPCM|nr:hypothetical protein O6H91_14G062900 [Diphasiastrum complanatum]